MRRIKSLSVFVLAAVTSFIFVDVPAAFLVMLGLGALHTGYPSVPAMGFGYVLLSLILAGLTYRTVTYEADLDL